jgi:hypothetical protein
LLLEDNLASLSGCRKKRLLRVASKEDVYVVEPASILLESVPMHPLAGIRRPLVFMNQNLKIFLLIITLVPITFKLPALRDLSWKIGTIK